MTCAELLLASPCQRLESSLSPAKSVKRIESRLNKSLTHETLLTTRSVVFRQFRFRVRRPPHRGLWSVLVPQIPSPSHHLPEEPRLRVAHQGKRQQRQNPSRIHQLRCRGRGIGMQARTNYKSNLQGFLQSLFPLPDTTSSRSARATAPTLPWSDGSAAATSLPCTNPPETSCWSGSSQTARSQKMGSGSDTK
jgi:hypothetical protein